MERPPPHSIQAISAKRAGGKKVPKKYRKYHKKTSTQKKTGGHMASRAVHYIIKAVTQAMPCTAQRNADQAASPASRRVAQQVLHGTTPARHQLTGHDFGRRTRVRQTYDSPPDPAPGDKEPRRTDA
ncbi:hypothetical protein OPT61_g9562 [Boeremia exigua]|uniref:Uncharacterized protein n=1 Tax=Boeremia exigua TaxID=749465 RepID=A0ACC2HTK9_9PLEO|nr:hypothetical protein OPT61_g9562 [Boeremia exigua]